MIKVRPTFWFILLAGGVGISSWQYINIRPAKWLKLRAGMTRSSVQDLIGPPRVDWNEVKGCFWLHDLPLARHRLNIVFNEQHQANFVIVTRELGTKDNFFFKVIYADGLTLSSTRTPPALPLALSHRPASSASLSTSVQAVPVSSIR